jgi:GTP-binding protein EngB required for normal cell division
MKASGPAVTGPSAIMPGTGSQEAAVSAGAGLSARLTALARMIQIGAARSGGSGFSTELLDDAEALLGRAGERLRLSAAHTVVALAGGTGSGKSSLFNKLAGAEFSTVGVTRPVTKEVHACVWGVAGSGSLLEWLGVPRRYRYARASALDRGEASLTGLALLDLPDHDSVLMHASDLVDHLVSQADLMIWVLDPQKYADAAVHRRFLVPLAGHAEVLAVVLNQSDLLDDGQVDDCVGDLRRLLDAEELQEVQILVTSALTGAGLDELRKLLANAVSARQAATARISADVDAIVARFTRYAGPAPAESPAGPDASRSAAAGSAAAGSAGATAAASAATAAPNGVPADPAAAAAAVPNGVRADPAAAAAAVPNAAAGNPPAGPGTGTNGMAAGPTAGPGTGAGDVDPFEAALAEIALAEAVASGAVSAAAADFPAAGGGAGLTGAAGSVSAGSTEQLVDAFARAAGVSAVGDALQSARELRAVDYVGWPVGWLAERLSSRHPVRKIRLGKLWDELRAVTSGPSGAQQAEIDNALTALSDELGPPLPAPWSQTARAAVRSRAEEIPGALGTAMGESLPAENKITAWWRMVGAWQGLLLGSVIVGLAWMAAIVVFGAFHVGGNVPRLFADTSLLPWIAAMIAALLLLGALTASACLNMVRAAAELESRQVADTMRARIAIVAREMVVQPAEQELAELGRFTDELRIAASRPVRLPAASR